MCRRTEEVVGPAVGVLCHRHFVGFFKVLVQVPTRGQPFNCHSEKLPHFSHLLQRT